MTSYVAKKVARHVLKEVPANSFGTEDPYFDYVTPHDLNGKPGKVKKTKKATPPGLTNVEAKVLKKVTRRAYRLDNCFSICGIRVGWSAIFGIIPGLGDVFDVFMAMMVYRTCCQAELPASLKSRMVMNIILDFAIGLVPILGDVADALYRANTRNASLLYIHLKERGAARVKGGAVDGETALLEDRKHSVGRGATQHQNTVTSPVKQTHHQPHQPLVSPSTQHGHGQSSGTVGHDSLDPEIRSPGYAKTNDGNKGGWLSRFTGGNGAASSRPEPDLEAGERRV